MRWETTRWCASLTILSISFQSFRRARCQSSSGWLLLDFDMSGRQRRTNIVTLHCGRRQHRPTPSFTHAHTHTCIRLCGTLLVWHDAEPHQKSQSHSSTAFIHWLLLFLSQITSRWWDSRFMLSFHSVTCSLSPALTSLHSEAMSPKSFFPSGA